MNTSKYQKSLIFLSSLLTGMAFTYYLGLTTSNMFALFFLILLYPFYQKAFAIRDKNISLASACCSLILTAFCFLAKCRFIWEESGTKYLKTIVYITGFFLFFMAVCINLYKKILVTDLNIPCSVPTRKRKLLVFFGTMGILLLAWLPYFLYLFPGDVTTDSNQEMRQAVGLQDLSNHHPIAHTFMIKIFYSLGQVLFHGDATLSVATYSICQAILLSASFAYLILTLYEAGLKQSALVITILFYAIPAYHGTYSVTMWKDIWFGGIMLVLAVTLWRIMVYCKTGTKKVPKFELIMLFIFSIATCLFRSNGLYAFVFLLLFLFIYFLPKKQMQILITATTALILAVIIKNPVYQALHVTQPDMIESLSIPAQQIACTIRDGGELTDEQQELLSQVVDISQVPVRYAPQISDSIKNLVRETDNQEFIKTHKFEFLKLWIDLGLKYPKSYLYAHLDQTYGYWYPDVQYWVYAGEFSTAGFDMAKENKLSENSSTSMNNWREAYKSYPYWGLLWSIGLTTWLVIFMAGAVFVKKRKSFLLVYMPMIGVFLTLMIATPVFAEFRYYYCAFTTIPLLCLIPFLKEEYFMEKISKNSETLETPEYENLEIENIAFTGFQDADFTAKYETSNIHASEITQDEN
ncbi:MAG: hypothetical protein K2G88_03540 [Oscillospiraceae bacterium]|nr:hypothetical protein [Oscillospiraceae bacterium]